MEISNLTEKRVKNMKESAVCDHRLHCDCVISLDDFDVLASDNNNFRLLIKESALIKRDKPILNRTIKSFPLKLFDLFISSLLYCQDSLLFYTCLY